MATRDAAANFSGFFHPEAKRRLVGPGVRVASLV